jgi:hypothetical protein
MTWVFGAMLEAGQPYFDTKTRKFQVNTPAGVAAIETIIEKPVKMGIELPGVATNQSDGLLQGSEGKLAMALTNGPGIVRSARIRNLETAPHLKWLLRPLFRGPRHYFVGEAGWGVVAFPASKNKDRVAPFLVHTAKPAAQKHWSVVRGCAPGATPAPQEAPECKTEEFADQRIVLGLQKFDETWRYYGPLSYGRMDAAYGAVGKAGNKIRAGEIGAKQAAQEIDEELQRELAKFDEDMAGIGVSMK